MITQLEFAQGYARRSHTTLDELARHKPNHEVRPCLNCDWPSCEGWALVPIDDDGPGGISLVELAQSVRPRR